ncbi:hypothetical protein SAMN04488057_10439 [Cyclobacterium lianum]|uniref:Uncharacterized protein n=1 Tax=Cyclobacterium lianum TaxID=388280 RepID=A0A1M7M137_9BACT|nr:hypothetical protein SAMN04488057_10439 [Cyclobacterium lianum]
MKKRQIYDIACQNHACIDFLKCFELEYDSCSNRKLTKKNWLFNLSIETT